MGDSFHPINVVVAGASGFFGSALVPVLEQEGCVVYRLVRRKPLEANEIEWDPQNLQLDPAALPESPVCINLSGENIGSGRWTAAKKKKIIESRVQSTRTFVDALMQLPTSPRHFISASATGIYGNRGDDTITERADLGRGFLADTCIAWEAEAMRLESMQVPVALLRFGIILGKEGGALARMLPAFRFGLGGKLGSGSQWMSWIAMQDAVYTIGHIISNTLTGPLNVTSPVPVRNVEFTKALARTLNRPAFCTVPAAVLKLLLGEFAEEALLSSCRVLPEKLIQTGFKFEFPVIDDALQNSCS